MSNDNSNDDSTVTLGTPVTPDTEFSNNGVIHSSEPVKGLLRELFDENVTAKIIRTAMNSLENNVSFPNQITPS